MKTLNLGILAHVDAGKTTLTERLLYAAGVLAAPGSVDSGDTLTDSLALERARGITIKSAVASFVVDEVSVNLIDTPGHPDFIAEVERVLCVLDGAVLVVSAVEGVQAQTRILFRALRRLGVPTLIFINKIDRSGARTGEVLVQLRERLGADVVAFGGARDVGTRAARAVPLTPADPAGLAALAEDLAEQDQEILGTLVDGGVPPYERLLQALRRQTAAGAVCPAFFGSAATGAGVDAVMDGIAGLLPAAEPRTSGAVSGTVFKVDRDRAGHTIAYTRLFGGTITVRDRIPYGNGKSAKVTALNVFAFGRARPAERLAGGQIGTLLGLPGVRIGDPVGTDGRPGGGGYFAPPTLETAVTPQRPADKGRLQAALSQLAEQDPLIDLRQDDTRGELYLSLYGEVQKEVIQATLAAEYDLDVDFHETTTICIERPTGTGTAVDLLGEGDNPFLSTVGLRIDPAPEGSGIRVELEVKVGTIPLYVYKTVEEFRAGLQRYVRATLKRGLYGWQVTDCVVTLTDSAYSPPGTSSRDVRLLTPLVLMRALSRAGTAVCEPIHRFRLELPPETLGSVLPALGRTGAVPLSSRTEGTVCLLQGDVPAARVHSVQQQLPGLTRGEGVFESAFDHYRPVTGAAPERRRTDLNPLNRKEYLLRVLRRM